MTVIDNPKVRLAIYIVSGVGDLIMAYAVSKGFVGVDEVALYSGLSALVKGLAAINVNTAQ